MIPIGVDDVYDVVDDGDDDDDDVVDDVSDAVLFTLLHTPLPPSSRVSDPCVCVRVCVNLDAHTLQ